VKNLPEIIAIFEKQNFQGRPLGLRRVFRVNIESDDLLWFGSSRWRTHSPKPISKTGALENGREVAFRAAQRRFSTRSDRRRTNGNGFGIARPEPWSGDFAVNLEGDDRPAG
jgi:hypothetical protein